MPTEMRSPRSAELCVLSIEEFSEPLSTQHFLLSERISVFTCATDYCSLLRPLAQQRDGMLLPDAQSLNHRTIACIADATKIVEQTPPTPDQEKQATP